MTRSNNSKKPFPSKLFELLDLVDDMELSGIISWLSHGRAFMVHDEGKFMSIVLPSFCNATQMRSFSRQLNIWGFKRIPSGKDAGGWFHESFLRGKPEKLAHIVRTKIKGVAGVEARRNFEIPDFYAMEPLNDTKEYRNNLVQDRRTSTPIGRGAYSKFCIKCFPRAHIVSTENVSLGIFSHENPSVYNMSAHRSNRVSLDSFIDSNTNVAQDSHRVERNCFQNSFISQSSCSSDFTPKNGEYVGPLEFSSSPVPNLEGQVQNNGTTSEMMYSRSNLHQVFCSLSDSLEYESAGEDDNLEPLPVAVSHDEDEFVSFINRTISDPFFES